jgi:hypothetical protein
MTCVTCVAGGRLIGVFANPVKDPFDNRVAD